MPSLAWSFETLPDDTGLAAGAALSSARAHHGTRSLRSNPTAGLAYSIFKWSDGSDITDSTVKVTLYVSADDTGSNNATLCAYSANESIVSGTVCVAYIVLLSNGTLQIWNGAETQSATTSNAVPEDGTWHRVDVTFAKSGTCSVALDGGTAASITGSAGGSVSAIAVGGLFSSTHDYHVDGLWIDTTANAPTDYTIECLRPTGAGSASTGWTAGTGSTFAEVDETDPDGDTTYIASATLNDDRSFALGDLSGTAYTSIDFVQGWWRGRGVVNPAETFLYFDSVAGINQFALWVSGDYVTQGFGSALNESAGAWSLTDVNALEIGQFSDDSDEKRITTAWVDVMGVVQPLTPVSAAYALSLESLLSVVGVYATPLESLSTPAAAYALSLESLLRVALTRALPLESLSSPASAYALSLESLLSVALTRALPLESLSSPASAYALSLEANLGASAAYAAPLEANLGASAAYAAPLEANLGASVVYAVPLESLGSTASAYSLPLESLLRVVGVYAAPLEANLGASVAYAMPLESLSAAALARALPLESLGSPAAAYAVPLEANLGASVVYAVPLESLLRVVGVYAAPLEANLGASAIYAAPLESLLRVAGVYASPLESLSSPAAAYALPLETKLLVNLARALPLEVNLGASRTLALPFESLLRVVAAYAAPLEAKLLVNPTYALPIEAHASPVAAYALPLEAFKGLLRHYDNARTIVVLGDRVPVIKL